MNDDRLSFLIREPAEVYHARQAEFLTSHALADFRRCPRLYRLKQLGLIRGEESEEYLVGTALHTLVLDGVERYTHDFAVGGPINPKTGNPFGETTKAFAEWAEQMGRPVLSHAQAALVTEMAAAVAAHDEAAKLLAAGVAEGVVRGRLFGEPAQARIDWINPDIRTLVDLKSTRNLDVFEQQIREYDYVHQVAFYRDLVYLEHRLFLDAHLIAVEKAPPHRVGVWEIMHKSMERASTESATAIRRLWDCRMSDHWPTNYEKVRRFDEC